MKIKLDELTARLSSVQIIVLYYLSAIIISTFLLMMPVTLQEGVKLSFIDALFTAVSAVSVTGLSTISLHETLSYTGTFILAFILQIGGIGVMTLGTFVWLILGRKIGLRERMLIMTDQNQSALSGLVYLLREILVLIVAIELIGALILGVHFLNYFPTWQEAFRQGLFASVSATTNAGFDITGQSLIPFANDYLVQTINILLIILGAIGFPVLIEFREFLAQRKKGHFRFSLFTKIAVTTFAALLVAGTVFIFIFEANHLLTGKNWIEAFFYSAFHSTSTRSAGLSTIDINQFSTPTHLLLCLFMFIGASPSSVGGGIRTTTFAIALLSVISYARGNSTIKVFKREIMPEDIVKSYIVIMTAFMLCGFSVIFLSFIEPSFSLMEILFEVSSAFGTTGMSLGITPELGTVGKSLLMTLMFIGRIGIFSFLFLVRGKPKNEKFHYSKERVIIG
ncbi:TrkH family potassium uptake protein [Neobacillus notoginsengisoli]|uniref:TrkH family potassium uptake protein n=1 Tax=Neobacillus notoginsengisoli TaxID=1578198 RepID=A0A417YW15_9BACI|nr:TrkH family potassium uptake protein [Neobacillus notoginsengisoli]RHW41488.1 TrkH family potassium uptake protein [Neobacillus notoginsengisoli]